MAIEIIGQKQQYLCLSLGTSYSLNSFFRRDDSLFLCWSELLVAAAAVLVPLPGGSSHIIWTFIWSTTPFSLPVRRDLRKLET